LGDQVTAGGIFVHADTLLTQGELAARWRELCADPDSPDFFELNEYGELILSPSPSNKHELVAFKVAAALEQQLGPQASTAISVFTKGRGVRRPDACWMPLERWRAAQYADPLPVVPDICVEVLSRKNTQAEIAMKTAAYLESGAQEVITIGTNGDVRYFGPEGQREVSALGVRIALPPELFE
jgi:Uma2 family endonuclease